MVAGDELAGRRYVRPLSVGAAAASEGSGAPPTGWVGGVPAPPSREAVRPRG